MSVTREEVIETARMLLGVRYRHQGRVHVGESGALCGPGVDCAGMLLFVGTSLRLTDLVVLGYSPEPEGERFERLLDENADRLERSDHARPGDILAFDFGKGIQHVGIVTGRTSHWRCIHATRKRGVHESALEFEYARAKKTAYRIRGVDS